MADEDKIKGQDNWSKGSNNLAPVGSLPEGFARELTNVDAHPTGPLALRAGYEKMASLTNARAAIAAGGRMFIAAGTQLLEFDPRTNALQTLRSIAGAGQLVGQELNGAIYLCTADEQLVVEGSSVREWGMDPVSAQVSLVGGGMPAGQYRVAVVGVDARGAESGANPTVLTLPANSGLSVSYTLPAGAVSARLYVGVDNGETLYLQDERPVGALTCTMARNDTQRLSTENLTRPPLGSIVERLGSRLLIAAGKVLYITEPYMPHLHHRISGFIQYPAPISVVKVAGKVVFVVADKHYRITDLGVKGQDQNEIYEFGAVPGSGVILPDKSVAWMTRYGQAIGKDDGSIALPNRTSYAPQLAERATAGVVEYNGNQLVVTAMRGKVESNGLAIRDTYGWEVV